MKKNKINSLNVYNIRRTEFCPPYFSNVAIDVSYNLTNAIDQWIQDNLSGRYYIGRINELSIDNKIKTKIKIGFEKSSETSFFMLSCPYLKYKN